MNEYIVENNISQKEFNRTLRFANFSDPQSDFQILRV